MEGNVIVEDKVPGKVSGEGKVPLVGKVPQEGKVTG